MAAGPSVFLRMKIGVSITAFAAPAVNSMNVGETKRPAMSPGGKFMKKSVFVPIALGFALVSVLAFENGSQESKLSSAQGVLGGLPRTWYFAEGTTYSGFETFILVQNPSTSDANVTLNYLNTSGVLTVQQVQVPAQSRKSINCQDAVGTGQRFTVKVDSDQPIVAERPMYFNYRSGGNSVFGALASSRTQFFPSGNTIIDSNGDFSTTFSLQNPNSVPAHVDVLYLHASGFPTMQSISLPANSFVNSYGYSYPGLNKEFSAYFNCDQPIFAERAIYLKDTGQELISGNVIPGANFSSRDWYLPGGSTQSGFETWILLQNPNSAAATVSVNYMTEHGPAPGQTVQVAGYARTSVDTGLDLARSPDFSTKIKSDLPIIAERAMYWNSRQAFHHSMGAKGPGTLWYFAEGSTQPGFETWVLVQNPGDIPATVTLNYATETGPVAGSQKVLVPGNSRSSVNTADFVSQPHDISIKVESDRPIVAERAMYYTSSDSQGDLSGYQGQAGASSQVSIPKFGHSAAGFTPAPAVSVEYLLTGMVSLNGTPLGGVTLSGMPGNPVTNALGQYTGMVPNGWTGTATPILAGYAFIPATRSYAGVAANENGQDYAAAAGISNTISLTSPHGGESWEAGSSQNIIWTTTGTIANVKIESFTTGAAGWTTIIASTPNTGTFPWTVPNIPAAQGLIRVSDALNGAVFDVGDSVFSITAPAPPKDDFLGT